jgi:hypothetical protein
MKAGLIIIAFWSLRLFLFSLLITGAFPFLYAGSFYLFTLPFIISSGLCFVLASLALSILKNHSSVFWVTTVLHGLLIIPYGFAMSLWPGGDDGPGMAWCYVLGEGSCVAAVVSIILVLCVSVSIIVKYKKRQKTIET